jgi:hypothetical protein
MIYIIYTTEIRRQTNNNKMNQEVVQIICGFNGRVRQRTSRYQLFNFRAVIIPKTARLGVIHSSCSVYDINHL